ncbi:MAG: HAD hydrolase-like protein [Planctomycetaceae bacterium]|nr:HAD hydrolase-like protein [Planctomycetaceae bacterium]MCB9952272.1 HAD hydrolase-like protein [Planctomycetaceae bacterium]
MSLRVCLFDIDGTLLTSGGAGQVGMERALNEVFGITNHDVDIPAAGRTDRAITTDLFRHHGIELHDSNIASFLAAYDRHLPDALASCRGLVYPGIEPLLDELSNQSGVVLGLLTGNYRVGADHKLRHYKLNQHFGFGGFGDHHENRDDVARAAMQSLRDTVQRDVDLEHVWVIGDTPADVRCARAIGAKVVAVATGIFSAEDLEQSKPDHLFHDFSNFQQFLALLD